MGASEPSFLHTMIDEEGETLTFSRPRRAERTHRERSTTPTWAHWPVRLDKTVPLPSPVVADPTLVDASRTMAKPGETILFESPLKGRSTAIAGSGGTVLLEPPGGSTEILSRSPRIVPPRLSNAAAFTRPTPIDPGRLVVKVVPARRWQALAIVMTALVVIAVWIKFVTGSFTMARAAVSAAAPVATPAATMSSRLAPLPNPVTTPGLVPPSPLTRPSPAALPTMTAKTTVRVVPAVRQH